MQGWGCGYRSLQTLCSWVVELQRKKQVLATPTGPAGDEFPKVTGVPTIPDIQSCLVAVGDKPPSFVGSREWIGCYEASIVLDQLFGVSGCMWSMP